MYEDGSAFWCVSYVNLSNALYMNLEGIASAPYIIPIGIMYGDNAASLIPSFPSTVPFTLSVWVYLFRTDQDAYMVAKVGTSLFDCF